MICSLAQMVVDFLWSKGPRLFGVYFGYLVGAGWRGNALAQRAVKAAPQRRSKDRDVEMSNVLHSY
jgi:hypothetical protein